MRIIAGKYKGKILNSFKLDTTRPTSDMVRSSLFNIIGEKIIDSDFLDLFGGTGACGIEADSRGAKKVTIVDHHIESINLINKNIKLVKSGNINVVNQDYDKFLSYCKDSKLKFDIIFIDPPYKSNFGEISIDYILDNHLVKDDGLIIWEHDKEKLQILDKYANFNIRTKKYGIKYLTIFEF